jgi:predicted dehydrogenase
MSVDYLNSPLIYKVSKVLRYCRLYGFRRTYSKIIAQLHMRQAGGALAGRWINKKVHDSRLKNIAIIGCGNFAFSNIAYYACKNSRDSIRAVYDVNGARALSLCRTYGGLYAASSPDEIFADPGVSIVFIASNHASHAKYAADAIKAGKTVHIEKPHVVSHEDLELLMNAAGEREKSPIYLGFNRPFSRHFSRIQESLGRESGPLMINWFIAGHQIDDDHWYFKDAEGGRVLGNLCHWTDLSLRMVGFDTAFPVRVIPGSPANTKSDFALTFNFADGSVCSITFSAKGHTFEGVREYLNVHKGNVLLSLRDFHELIIDRGSTRTSYKSFYRDHGHKSSVLRSILGKPPIPLSEVDLTAKLFLAAKQALAEQRQISVTG